MVATCRVPTVDTLVRQARVAVPFTRTVQAPHWPTPQPNLVPFILRTSRSTHSRGMSGGTSTVCVRPFTLSEYTMRALLDALERRGGPSGPPTRRMNHSSTASVRRCACITGTHDGTTTVYRPAVVVHVRARKLREHDARIANGANTRPGTGTGTGTGACPGSGTGACPGSGTGADPATSRRSTQVAGGRIAGDGYPQLHGRRSGWRSVCEQRGIPLHDRGGRGQLDLFGLSRVPRAFHLLRVGARDGRHRRDPYQRGAIQVQLPAHLRQRGAGVVRHHRNRPRPHAVYTDRHCGGGLAGRLPADL